MVALTIGQVQKQAPQTLMISILRAIHTHPQIIVVALVSLSVALPARVDSFSGTGNPTLTTGDAPDSICPYGWRLPRYKDDGSYHNLMTNIYQPNGANKDTMILSVPLNFTRSGRYYTNSNTLLSSDNIRDQATIGVYWLSKINGKGRAYDIAFESTRLRFDDNSNDSRGWSLRCLAR